MPRTRQTALGLPYPPTSFGQRTVSADEGAAQTLADAIGGQVWQSGEGIYVVSLRRPDGSTVVMPDDLVAGY